MLTLQGAFAEFVDARMKNKDWSTYDVARQSGGAITHQTVWSVINSRVNDMKLSTLLALARGLKLADEEAFDAVRGKSRIDQTPAEMRAASLFKELPIGQQETVLIFLETLHQQHAVKPAEVKRSHKTKRPAA